MIWALSIATFLSTILIVLILGVLFSRRDHIRKALKEMRKESRTLTKVALELSRRDEAFAYETAATENVSRHGARIVTKTNLSPNERVLVRLPQADERAVARIAYCNAMPGSVFAVGLHFPMALDFKSADGSMAGSSLKPYGK